ncbi:hypothetical protein D9M72_596730 [compost metagenome]
MLTLSWPSVSNWRVSSMASSIASLVPEPMAKCAVWALSPIRTTWLLPLKWLHFSQINRPKFSQAEPRTWRALVISL